MRATISSFLANRAIAAKSLCRRLPRYALGMALWLMGAACQQPAAIAPQLAIQQQWQLPPGTVIADRQIVGGLGDISIDLGGSSVYAPFSGSLQMDGQGCAIFSSPDLPAYLARLCGLRRLRSGDLQAGDRIGSGQMLHFAALRKQPDGSWAMVEPSSDLLTRFLTP
ncbi:MAG: hypothetical protein ACFB5Z_09985 [Elainellaceae cyanobacterium]